MLLADRATAGTMATNIVTDGHSGPDHAGREGRFSPRPSDGIRGKASVWDAPGLRVQKKRSWPHVSASLFSRAAGEGCWRNDEHRICVPLLGARSGTVQIENGRTEEFKFTALNPIQFSPAGITARWVLEEDNTCLQIVQSRETYRNLASEITAPGSAVDLQPIFFLDDPQLAALVQSIVNEIDGGFLDNLLVEALDTALAIRIVRHFLGPTAKPFSARTLSRERLQRVLDYVDAHLGAPLSLNEIAGVACLSPYHFSRCFKHSMGVGPYRYVVVRRIERARRLLTQTEMPLADIAAAVGFDSQSSFTARFRREAGVSPGRLRKQMA